MVTITVYARSSSCAEQEIRVFVPFPSCRHVQGLIDPRSACNSAYACRDGKMLVVTKNPNVWVGGKGSCAVCVDLQAVEALEFFGELYSLAKGLGPFLRGFGHGFREREGSIFSNHQHFVVSTGICKVACPLPAKALGLTQQHRSSYTSHSSASSTIVKFINFVSRQSL